MYISPLTIGVAALFILSRLAAAAVSRPDFGDLKPAHSRHPYEGGEKVFAFHHHRLFDNRYAHRTGATVQEQELGTNLRQRQLIPPTTQRVVNKMLLGALFRRAAAKSHSSKSIKVNYGNLAQLERQSNSILRRVISAGNEYQALQRALAGIPGGAGSSLAQKDSQIRNMFNQLQDAYRHQAMALHSAQSTHRQTETNDAALWGHSPGKRQKRGEDNRFNVLSRRASIKPHKASPAKGVKVSSSSLAKLEQQRRAIDAKVDEAWREQQVLEKALGGTGLAGNAAAAMLKLQTLIDQAFKQLHSLLH